MIALVQNETSKTLKSINPSTCGVDCRALAVAERLAAVAAHHGPLRLPLLDDVS